MRATYLFVYGTLRSGSDNEHARLLAKRGTFADTAHTPGRLYDFGHYPGARPTNQPEQFVVGELFFLAEPGALLGTLDQYEGPEFERAMTTAMTRHGHSSKCWIYWYVGPEPGRLIPSGDWFNR